MQRRHGDSGQTLKLDPVNPKQPVLYKCERCRTRFVSWSRLENHVMAHKTLDRTLAKTEDVKPKREKDFKFQCTECGKKFVSKLKLAQHIEVHEASKPAIQYMGRKECKKTLNNLRNDASGVNNDTRKSPPSWNYYCAICANRFLTTEELSQHTLNVHKCPKGETGPKEIRCTPCKKWFKSEEGLRKHVEKHIKSNCQGTQDTVRLQNMDFPEWFLPGAGLHTIMGEFSSTPGSLTCQATEWEACNVADILDSETLRRTMDDFLTRILDYQCTACSKWFLCPIALRTHFIVTHFGR